MEHIQIIEGYQLARAAIREAQRTAYGPFNDILNRIITYIDKETGAEFDALRAEDAQ